MNKVFGVPLSPFVRKVFLTLDYKQVAAESVFVLPGSEDPNFRAMSPTGKIPAYEDEYIKICDSSVICQYLEDKYPSPAIYPNNPRDKARALWLEEYGDGKLMELLGAGIFFELIVAPTMMGRAPNHQRIAESKKQLPPFLTYLEKQIHGDNPLIGSEFTIADFSIPTIFMNAHYAGYDVDKYFYPKLYRYIQMMWEHPLYQKRFAEELPIVENLKSKI